ncbi:uncharacterized protein N0V89_003247 [Didymosphaeria variabile]|uniref:AB hydrolase-1 domain-containing protein n=1 Tax=Didymosphaeria variabile TaxID=1932322 RepID=A0A9W8XV11_9PLEO|nr:uncharacterized protein N0V89_003247 [Didymosphaeria variabile]KAJ4358663.1 hypothetical protein N0V89_003247 [Didymosphaeria variabile]
MAKPTVLFMHGSWHTPAHFAPVRAVFENAGYPTSCPRQPSTRGLATVGLAEDAERITSELVTLIEGEEKDVIVVAHSYGGVVATQAVRKRFARQEREKEGEKGGVLRIVYMCAFLLQDGENLMGAFGIGEGDALPPFIVVDDRKMCTMADPAARFYSDLSLQEQQKWVGLLVPNAAHTQATPITHAAYLYHPVTYLFCEKDEALPLEVQEQMVEKVRALGVKVVEERCAAGHSPYLSMPETVLDVIERME